MIVIDRIDDTMAEARCTRCGLNLGATVVPPISDEAVAERIDYDHQSDCEAEIAGQEHESHWENALNAQYEATL